MAVQEFEHQTDPVVVEEQSPMDFFKESLHGMVIEVESTGKSALGHLLAIRSELRDKRIALMRESSQVEQRLRQDPHNEQLIADFGRLQEGLVLVYHQLKWLEGYVHDR